MYRGGIIVTLHCEDSAVCSVSRRAFGSSVMPERKPYDSAYKLLFSHKSIFHQFLTRFVDKEVFRNLKVDDLELVDRSFISDNFKRREADIIYRVKVDRQDEGAGSVAADQPRKDVYVYVITEFQSTVDKSIPVRLQLYISMLHDLLLRNGHKGNLPVVLPIVLYTGTKPWTIPENTTKLIGHGVLLEYILPFKYYCLEERNISEERAKQLKGVYAAITIANKQENEEFLREKIDVFLDLIQDDDKEALRAFVSYLGNMFGQVLTDEDIDQINNPLKVKEGIMHLAERIEQNNLRRIEQVRQESIERGKREGRQERYGTRQARGH